MGEHSRIRSILIYRHILCGNHISRGRGEDGDWFCRNGLYRNYQQSGVYGIGDTIEATATFDTQVSVTGTPWVLLKVGLRQVVAEYIRTENKGIVFAYIVQENDRDDNGVSVLANQIHLGGGAIMDEFGHPVNLEYAGLSNQDKHRVDGVRPYVVYVDISPQSQTAPSGGFVLRDTVVVDVYFNEPVLVKRDREARLTLDVGGQTADAVNECTRQFTWYTYKVQEGDFDHDGIQVVPDSLHIPDGGWIRDEAGNDAILTHGSNKAELRNLVHGHYPPAYFTSVLTIDGDLGVGKKLEANTDSIKDPKDGIEEASFTFQWMANDEAIPGATGNTYTPVEEDQGKRIRVSVRFDDDRGNPEIVLSAKTEPVPFLPGAEPPPPTPTPTPIPDVPTGPRISFGDGVAIPDQKWTEGEPVSLQLPPADGASHYGVDSLPAGLAFDEQSRTILGKPETTASGSSGSTPVARKAKYLAWASDPSDGASLTFSYAIIKAAPTAKAGPDLTAAPGQSVTLQGKGSTNPYGRWHQMAHQWTQLSGPPVTLTHPRDSRQAANKFADPSFTIPADAADGATLEFELTVTDQEGQSDSDTVIVTVAAPEVVRPTATAGPDLTGAPGESVTLQGKGSVNPYGRWHQMAHQWTQLSGPPVTLTHPRTSQPTGKFADPSFTIPADAAGGTTLEFQLTVTDKEGQSDSDTMTVTVTGAEPANTPPTASIDAGQVTTAVAGDTVELQGVGNDAETAVGSLTFAWSQVGGTPSVSIAGASTATASFTAPDVTEETSLTFRLTVTDEGGLSAAAETTIAISPPPEPENTPPTAGIDAAQITAAEAGETVALQGVGGDAETASGSLTFAWTQVGGTPTVSIINASTATASFTAPDVTGETSLTFRLTVTDEGGLSATAETTIAISPPPEPANTPPTASIDAAQVAAAEAGDTVQLQGVGNDAETAAGSLTFAWTQVGGTPTVSIANASAAAATFTAPDVTAETSLTFRLTVTDEGGLSATAETTVTVSPPLEPENTPVTSCFTDLGELTTGSELSGAWDDADCRAHHRADSPARYIQFTVSEETEVSITLTSESGGALFVSKDTPQNGWGTPPGATYEHRVNVRLNNGKLLHADGNAVTLTLAPGETYTVEAASTSDGGSFTLTIEPQ